MFVDRDHREGSVPFLGTILSIYLCDELAYINFYQVRNFPYVVLLLWNDFTALKMWKAFRIN